MTEENTLRLSAEYRYDGEQTTEIPYESFRDLGGAVLVECPDGSTRAFPKTEVVGR